MKILDYKLQDKTILISFTNSDSEKEISIEEFEIWLDESSKLEWINDKSDHNGEHKQSSGKFMDFDEYYESTKKEDFLNDLQEYLTEKENSIFEKLAQITKPN